MAFPESQWVVTVRYGVAEITEGAALPGTPAPVATVRTDGATWRRLALQLESPAAAMAAGRLEVDGSHLGLASFLGRFDRGL